MDKDCRYTVSLSPSMVYLVEEFLKEVKEKSPDMNAEVVLGNVLLNALLRRKELQSK